MVPAATTNRINGVNAHCSGANRHDGKRYDWPLLPLQAASKLGLSTSHPTQQPKGE